MIRFQSKYLKQLFVFVSDYDLRAYLKGIYIMPHADGGAVLIATDGHKLIAIRDADAIVSEPALILVDKAALRYAKPDRAAGESWCQINPTTGRLTILTKRGSSERYLQPGSCLMDASTFPKVMRVFPDFKKLQAGAIGSVNCSYLHKVASIAPGDARHAGGMRFWQEKVENHQALKPFIIQFVDMPEIMVIVMPLHNGWEKDSSLTDWVRAFAPRPVPEVAA